MARKPHVRLGSTTVDRVDQAICYIAASPAACLALAAVDQGRHLPLPQLRAPHLHICLQRLPLSIEFGVALLKRRHGTAQLALRGRALRAQGLELRGVLGVEPRHRVFQQLQPTSKGKQAQGQGGPFRSQVKSEMHRMEDRALAGGIKVQAAGLMLVLLEWSGRSHLFAACCFCLRLPCGVCLCSVEGCCCCSARIGHRSLQRLQQDIMRDGGGQG